MLFYCLIILKKKMVLLLETLTVGATLPLFYTAYGTSTITGSRYASHWVLHLALF